MQDNLGIAAYNKGFEMAQGDYILVLDDDSHPVDNATLDRLILCLDSRPEIGAVACNIEDIKGRSVLTWHLPPNGAPGPSIAFVGCGFAIRRDLFKEIGWYPEEFFLYQNEVDVAIKMMNQGYQIHFDPDCRVIHRCSPVGRTSWRQVFYPTRNTIWLIRRYFPRPIATYMIASRLCFGLIRATQSLQFSCYWQAVREAFNKPIEPQVLSLQSRRQLSTFWRQNSLWHHLTGRL